MSNVRGKIIDPKKPLMVRSWRRTRLPYSDMVEALKAGHAYFLAGVKRQTAHTASRILTRKLGVKVAAYSAIYEGEKGYAFFRVGLEEWVKRATREGWLKEEVKPFG
jgi:hypothetical protein